MSVVKYSIALRCIGQDLQRRALKSFDLRVEGEDFIVVSGAQELPASTPQSIRYTPANIESSHRHGEEERGKAAKKEFLHQAQMLRAIGEYLDKYDSTLIRITNNDVELEEALFRVEYLTREGEHVLDDRPGSAIFDICVLMYQKRGNKSAARGTSSSPRR